MQSGYVLRVAPSSEQKYMTVLKKQRLMAWVCGKRGQVLLLRGLKPRPREVTSGESCWRTQAQGKV